MHLASCGRKPLVVGLLALAALVAACGSSNATASPAASAAASPAASSGAVSGPSASAGSASLEGIAIAQPYTLADLPAATGDAIQAGIEKNLGAYGKAVHVAMKAITQNALPAAYLMVVQFPPDTLSDTVYAQVINNLSMGAESSFTPKLVNGVSVYLGTMSGGSVAVFRKGDLAFITLAIKATDLTPIAAALIQVNG
jgi:hypothetical protein